MKKSTFCLSGAAAMAVLCLTALFIFKNFTLYDGFLAVMALIGICAYFVFKKKGE